MFEVLKFCVSSVCYHYTHLQNHLPQSHSMRSSPLFAAIGNSWIRKYAVYRFPSNKTNRTPFFTGIPPHVVMMNKFQEFQDTLKVQANVMIESLHKELNERGVGGEGYQASKLVQEMKEHNLHLMRKIDDISNSLCSGESRKKDGSEAALEDDGYIVTGDDKEMIYDGGDKPIEDEQQQEETEQQDNDSNTDGQRQKGIVLKWANCKGGQLRYVSKDFVFPKSMSFPNMLTMWYCGDKSHNIPPYKVLRGSVDLKHLKSGKHQLSMMRRLVKAVERGARDVVGNSNLIKRQWTPRAVLDLFEGTFHLFKFPTLTENTKRRYDTISWKSYYNILDKRKWKLLGEQRNIDDGGG